MNKNVFNIVRDTVNKHTLLFAGIINIVLFAIIYFSRTIVFETVDDFNVMYTIAGYKTGEPYFQLTFYNTILAFFTTIFYRIYDGIQWYAVFQLLMLYASATALLWVVIEKIKNKKISITAVTVVYILCFWVFMLYPVQRMQFTTSAAALGMGACALLYSIKSTTDKKLKSRMIASIVFLVLCFMERRMVSLAIICFWALGIARLLFIALYEEKIKLKTGIMHIWKFVVAAAAIILVVNGADTFIKNNFDNAEYMEYDEYRGMYQDYDKPTYEEATELYNSVGWDKNVFNLVSKLLYLDENINKDSFKTLVESDQFTSGRPLKEALKTGRDLFKTNPTARASLVLAVLLFVFEMLVIAFNWKNKKKFLTEALIAVFACLGAFCLCLYLCIGGRFLIRIFQTIAIPTIGVLIINFANILSKIEVTKKAKIVFGCVWACVCLISIYPVFIAGRHIYVYLQDKDSYSDVNMEAFEDYAAEHPENIYVHDYSVSNSYNSYNPFRIREGQLPTNIIISGGSYTFTGCYYKQLEVNGLDELWGETLFNNNVYYVCDTTKSTFIKEMTTYLKGRNGTVNCELIDIVGNNVEIYKFSLPQ